MKIFKLTKVLLIAVAVLFFQWGTVFGQDSLYIDPNGNVGIGTANPQAKLHIENNGDYLTLDHLYGSGRIGAYQADGSAKNILLWPDAEAGDNPRLRIYGHATDLGPEQRYVDFRINSWGKFLIGGNAVSILFEGVNNFGVKDDVHLQFGSGAGDYRITYDTANTQLELWSTDINGSGTDGNVMIIKDGTDDVIFNGSVGIGTASPAERLQVEGNIVPGTDNQYDLGTSSLRWQDIWATNPSIQTSDERLKENITDLSLGLDFIARLRPIAYKWKDYDIPEIKETRTVTRQKTQLVTKVVPEEVVELIDGKYVQKTITTTEQVVEPVFEEYPLYDEAGFEIGIHRVPVMETVEEEVVIQKGRIQNFTQTHYGLSAQDLKGTLESVGVDFGGYVYDEKSDQHGIRWGEFVPILINAIQELKAEVDQLKAEKSLPGK